MCNICSGRNFMSYTKLLKCGWCGSDAEEIEILADITSSNYGQRDYIGYRCSNPDCPIHDRVMLLEQWNRRK